MISNKTAFEKECGFFMSKFKERGIFMADGGKVIIKIDGDTKPFENSMGTAKDGLNSLNKSFAAIGAVGAAGFAAATKAGMSF